MALIPDGKGGFIFQGATPQNAGVNLGVRAASPMQNMTTGTPALPKNMTAPQTPPQTNTSTGIDYTLHPGESIEAYNSRISTNRGTTPSSPTLTSPSAPSTPPTNTQPPIAPPVANPQYSVGPGLYGQLITGLANTAGQPTAPYLAAQQQALAANQALAQSKKNEAEALAANAQNPIPLEFQQGRGQVLQGQYQQQQAALASELQGAAGLAGAATGQQQAQQAGLGAAAGLAAPQQYGVTGVPFNPATGQFGGIAGAGTTGGGIFGAGQVTQGLNLGQQSAQLQATQRQTEALTGQLNQLLDANPNINPAGISIVNGLVQLGAQQLGDPNYQTFANLINDLTTRYATILTPAGGNPTDTRLAIAQSMINAQASPASIKQVINSLEQQAKAVISQLNPGAGTQSNQPQGGTSGNTFGSFFGG